MSDKPGNLNTANIVTALRIIGVPVFGWLVLHNGGDDIYWRVWAWVAFTLLMLTDRVDGIIARRRNLVTNFGKLADPIADKALTGMALIGLSVIGVVWWWVTIVILLREWGITAIRFGVRKQGIMPANQAGKIKTVLQSLALAGYLLPFELWIGWWAYTLHWATHVAMAAALVVTVVTGITYVRDAVKLRASAS